MPRVVVNIDLPDEFVRQLHEYAAVRHLPLEEAMHRALVYGLQLINEFPGTSPVDEDAPIQLELDLQEKKQ